MLTPNMILQNRYKIERLLAQGGMGAVYLATDLRLGNTVALKETLFSEERLRNAFEREAKLLANLYHPALPKVSDHFVEGEGQFLVMAYIPGDDLYDLVTKRGKPFPINTVLEWADQTLDILEYLHSRQPAIIHRDIKPANLKLTPEGHIVLLDFGMARGAGSSIAGYSVNYAPPEQIDQISTDGRSDLYALGATLYHLATAVPPPSSITRAVTVAHGEPDPLRPACEVNPQIPQAVSDILMKSMALERTCRQASATEMRQAFRQTQQTVQASQSAKTLVAPSNVPVTVAGVPPTFQGQARLTPTPATVAASMLPQFQSNLAGTVAAPQPQFQAHLPGTIAAPMPQLQVPANGPGAGFEGPPPLPIALPVSGKPIKKAGSAGWLIGLMGVVLIGLMIGGYFLFKPKPAPVTKTVERVELLQFNLEVNPSDDTNRVTGEEPFKPGQVVKFHITPRSNGYLYILAPGKGNVPMTFLTDIPIPASGVKTNRLEAGVEYEFPSGEGNWIGLREDAYTTAFTLIFSDSQLEKPKCLTEKAGQTLNLDQQKEFEDFREKNLTKTLETKSESQGKEPVMKVTVGSKPAKGVPLVFDITLKRKSS